MARRARALTEADASEWARFAHRIAPLRGRPPIAPPDDPVLGAPVLDATEPASRPISPAPPRPVRAGPLGIGGQPAGVDTSTWQRFHRGKLGTSRKLDLHGMTAQAAFHSLRSFLRAAHTDRLRCVEIVTGKGGGEGGGVIRREFPLWLNLPDIRPMVLAAAHPHAANPGAVRLLLRRPRP